MKFCPKCHREVKLPDFLKGSNVKINGECKISCGNCKKGIVIFKQNESK